MLAAMPLATSISPSNDASVAAVLGGAVSLAGLLLVFIGFLFSQITTAMSDPRQAHYRRAARFGLIPFCAALALAIVAASYWLVPSDPLAHFLLMATIALAIAIGAYGLIATLSL
jgi:hypothetical protein